MILGEMCVVSLIYSYVTVRMFCAVRCVVIICCYLLFCNYLTGVFKYSSYVCFLVLYFRFLLCVMFLYRFVYCFSFSIYIAVSLLFLYKSTDRCQQVETKLQ